MARRSQMEIANFICKFGADLNLVDFAEEIVVPAFMAGDRRRTYGATEYFFLDQALVELAPPGTAGIVGRFVKNTVLRSEQRFESDKGLLQLEEELPSAPSALFLLALGGHKLLFLPETSHPPTLKSFESTARHFLQQERRDYVKRVLATRLEEHARGLHEQRPTRKAVEREVPAPQVDVIPISGREELRAFIDRFARIRSVELRLVPTNDEIDNEQLIRDLRESKAAVGAQTTKLIHQSREGLSKDGVFDQVNAAALQGNSEIRVNGDDSAGGQIAGDNHEFRLRVPVEHVEGAAPDTAAKMYSAYEREIAAGNLPASDVAEAIRARLRTILQRLGGRRR